MRDLTTKELKLVSGGFDIVLGPPVLSFTFTPEPGVASGTITFNGTTQAIGAGNLSIVFPHSVFPPLPVSKL